MRSYIIIFASIAIPIDKIIPAIPGSDRLARVSTSVMPISAVYAISESPATIPGTRYTITIKAMTSARPISPAYKLDSSAISPSAGPIALSRTSINVTGSCPAVMIPARYSTPWRSKFPVI
jgi:hypothetical protein